MTMWSVLDVHDMQKTEARASHSYTLVSIVVKSLREHVCGTTKSIAKVAKEDVRRVVHSLKVGLALTLVSLFYYFQPLYDSFGVSVIWAVITVVVVFEFYVGATLGKGVNRALGTLLGGVLAVGAHLLAGLCTKTTQLIIISLFVFLQAATCTFLRFFPKMKARYDYSLLVCMMTFCIISITGVRQDQIMELAHKRLATIVIGAFISLLVSILVCPVWAGQDLHNSVARNIEHLANYLDGFGATYFNTSGSNVTNDHKSSSLLMQGYKFVLNSKVTEDSLANFALWEPPHGKFILHHPWKHYLKLGALLRKCSYRIDTLNSYVNSETERPLKIQEEIEKACKNMSSECSKALKQIATSIKATARPRAHSIGAHIQSSKEAMGLWRLHGDNKVIFVGAMLEGIVECTEEIAELANELASLARFEEVVGLSGCGNEPMECDIEIAVVDPECEVDGDLCALDLEMNGPNVEV